MEPELSRIMWYYRPIMSNRIGIIGTTGVVGREILTSMKMLDFEPSTLHLYASERSAGRAIKTPFGTEVVQLTPLPPAIPDLDVMFLAAGSRIAESHGRQLADRMLVVDSSSHFRYDDDVPLVIPPINGHVAESKNLIANPNCTTAILAMALWPIHQRFGIEKVMVSTYQAASGAGKAAMDELKKQTQEVLKGKEPTVRALPAQLAFNLVPRIDRMEDNGYTREEMKVTWELRKIMEIGDLAVSCTAVRVPTLRAHAESCIVTTEKPVDIAVAREVLSGSSGVILKDNPSEWNLPMPLTASGRSAVEVGRLRHNLVFGEHSLELFICGDQLLRGAAYNAVEIAKQRLQHAS